MSTPPEAVVTRSTVVAGSDPGRVALAMVLHRLAARHWVDVLVPAALVFALEWLLGLPLVVGLLLAVATAAVLVTVRIWQARRRFARTFPVGERLTVTAGPDRPRRHAVATTLRRSRCGGASSTAPRWCATTSSSACGTRRR